MNRQKPSTGRWVGNLLLSGCLTISVFAHADAQTEQRVEVRIHDYAFIASQAPLMLNTPAVIAIRNEDGVGIISTRRCFKELPRKSRPVESSRMDEA
jgi:hypothetical protein